MSVILVYMLPKEKVEGFKDEVKERAGPAVPLPHSTFWGVTIRTIIGVCVGIK